MELEKIIKEFWGRSDRELLHEVLYKIHLLNIKIDKIMSQNDDFSAALDKLDSDINAVAAELAAIQSQTPPGALTADQAAALLARIGGEQTKLEALVVPATPPASTDAGATS